MKAFSKAALLMAALYLVAYVAYRTTHTESRGGQAHVVYPHNESFAYSLFRPMAHLDQWFTGRPTTVATDLKWTT